MDDKGLTALIREYWIAISAGCAACAVVIARTQAAAKVVKKTVAWIVLVFGAAQKVMQTLEKQNAQLARIEGQLLTNGGGSLRDKIDATHRLVLIAAARSRFLIAESSHATYECNLDGQCTYASPALCAMFGLTEHEMMGNGWQQAIKEEELQTVRESWKRAIDQDFPYEQNYTVVHRRHAKEYKLHTSMKVVRDGYGKPIAYHGKVEYRSHSDITPAI